MDAINCGKEFVKNEPFAVLLPDNIMVSRIPCLKQLIELYNKNSASRISYVIMKEFIGGKDNEEVDMDRVKAHLISKTTNEYQIDCIKGKKKKIEKLKKGQKGLKIFGRYIFSDDVFNYVKRYRVEYRGEFDDTPIFSKLAEEGKLRGKIFNGLIFDTGNIDGYNETIFYFSKNF